MTTATLALALGAGLLAALNPCGFALLPAWMGLVLQGTGESGAVRASARAVLMAAQMTLGFVLVFLTFAVVAVPLTLSLERFLPWATVVVGLMLVGLGVWLLRGHEFGLAVPGRRAVTPGSGRWSMVAYGVGYALASLSCTVGPFLAVLASTTRSGGVGPAVLVVLAYTAGMGLLVTVLAVAVATARTALVVRMRRLTSVVGRASGVLLLVAGAYVAWYGAYEVRVLGGAGTSDPVVDVALTVQAGLARTAVEVGPVRLLLVLVGLSLMVGLGSLLTRRGRTRRAQRTAEAASTTPLP